MILPFKQPFDIIICTASSNAIDLASMLRTVAVFGSLINVGMPEDPFSLRSQHFAGNGASLQGESTFFFSY